MTWNTPKPQEWKSEELSQGRIIDYKAFNFVDGEGVRNSLYVSGCMFHCEGCYNAATWSFKAGIPYTKELEEQMIKNEELYNNNIKIEENKNKYLVNLSHELRTPLNVISSTNQLLLELSKKDAIKSDKLAYYIDISERNCNRLLNLVNNILDNTKLQSKMYTLNLKEVDIIYLVEETSLTLIDYIKSKSIELIIDPEVEEKIILCDDYEIERCIVNLVSNAAKFTPEGGNITITIKDLDDKVMISVLDTGVGIEEKYHKTIFDRFNQVDNDESKGGSGLGLSITSKIVELHKGEIYVESKVGEGSNFVIILPVDPNKE